MQFDKLYRALLFCILCIGFCTCEKPCNSNTYYFTNDESQWVFYTFTSVKYIEFIKNTDGSYKQDTVSTQIGGSTSMIQPDQADNCGDSYELGGSYTQLPAFATIQISLSKQYGIFSAQFNFYLNSTLTLKDAMPDSNRTINGITYTGVYKFIIVNPIGSNAIKTAYFVKGVGFIEIDLNNGNYCTLL